ncbi:MAG: hypothetical protein AB1589_11175 [Cyanobacteriota bacterium]
MASTTFDIYEFTGTNAQVQVTLTDVETDTVQVTLQVDSSVNIADLVGFFADFDGISVNNNFSLSSSDFTVDGTKGVKKLFLDDSGSTSDNSEVIDSNVNLNGDGQQGNYQLAVQIGAGGRGQGDDYQSVTFTLTAPGLDVSDFSKVGVRLQSVGSDRNGSSKLEGNVPPLITPNPVIAIDKVTQGADGLTILEGSDITWTYTVSNAGNVGLSNVSVLDNSGTPDDATDDFYAEYASGDNGNGILDVGESWTYTASGTAIAGNYSNIGTATGSYNNTTVNATDPSSYFGAAPAIDIDKVTNGADGLTLVAGSDITWTYTVNNTGNVGLSNVTVKDDNGTPNNTSDDFTAEYASGDNGNGVLDVGESWVFKATGTAIAGDYSNIGTVTGVFTDDLGNSKTVDDADESSYTGETGVANTPGFWKQSQHFQYWAGGYKTTDSFKGTFGVNVAPSGVPDSLLGALGAGGGGVNALGRAGTAALLNAASDAAGSGINYVIDKNALAISVGKVGANYDSVLATLDIIDIDNNLRIDVAEVKGAVKDALTNNEGFFNGNSGIQQVAIAFDAMNNMPSLEKEFF